MSLIIIEPRIVKPRQGLSWGALLLGLAAAGLFVLLAQRPLSHTDLWGHLAYGRYYAELGFPQTEPFLTHSNETPFVATAWLSQWSGYQIQKAGGPPALQLTYALIVSGIAIVFFLAIKARTNSHLLGLFGTTWFLWLEYQQLLTIRPQLAGVLCFTIFLFMLGLRKWREFDYVRLGMLMTLWANLHGSFIIAPVTLCLIIIGHSIDVFCRYRRRDIATRDSLSGICRDRKFQQFLTILAVTSACTLINPYGPKLWWEVLNFSRSSNLYDLIEWKPLWKTPKQGTVVLYSLIATSGLLFSIRCRLRAAQWLPVIIFGALMINTSRYIVWWVPLFVLAVTPVLKRFSRGLSRSRIFRRISNPLERLVPGGMIMLWVVAILTVSATVWKREHKTNHPDSFSKIYSRNTPVEATLVLNAISKKMILNKPSPLIFNTMEWGDWLIWSSEAELPVFVNSHVPLIEEQAWKDYMSFIRQSDGWKERWNTYHFSAAVVQYRRHDRLAKSLDDDPQWKEIWRDDIAVIYLPQPRPK